MKKMFVLASSVIILQAFGSTEVNAHSRGSYGGATISFSVFYEELSPYGEWIPSGGGVYGWRPIGVRVGWRPYTVGRWCWTDDGWYWLSDEPWGWATFHYGRWHYDDYYGWIWIPGYDWAPAWVEWRYGAGSIGWAPLSPYAVFSIHWGIHYRTRWHTPVHWWNFVDCGYISHHGVHRYVYRNEHNSRYIGNTRGGGSVRYDGGRIRSRGPEREYVEREGRTRIENVAVREIGERPDRSGGERFRNEGGRGEIEVYRPHVEARSDDADAIRPGRVREERGRTLDLDTRKIDGRSRDGDRDEVGAVRRSEEAKQREEAGRREVERLDVDKPRDMGRPSDENRQRDAAGRSREDGMKVRERERVFEQPKEDRNIEQPRREQGRPETRERKRQDVFSAPQRDEQARPERNVERRREYSMPERRSEPRMEMPRKEAPRSSERGRSEGQRSDGGRSEGGRRGR